MTRIFVTPEALAADTVTLSGKDAVHVASALRMKAGEKIILCDGAGNSAVCTVGSSSPDAVVCCVNERFSSQSELRVNVHFYQALPKSDKFEFIIQKLTELGAAAITPVLSDRCVSRPDERSLEKKLRRWSDIAREAAQQSGRGIIPEITPAVNFTDAVASADGLRIFCDEDERETPLSRVLRGFEGDSISVFIGPEGGWAPRERRLAVERLMTPVTFGPRILRCETAPVYVMSCIGYEFG
ncbi:MAG: 16S rRNA (uracil(1498)-N(3))-methyltransferase [Clostridia bacterium]|nr:16S rRNA (uracil(1498)-N(3))-methyltransferase [Clostridia bacterium]